MLYVLLLIEVVFICAIAVFFIILFKIFGYIYTYLFWGAINVPTTKEKVKQIINLLNPEGKKKAVDLGSGNGRLSIALAKAGFVTYGYEINPFLVKLSRKNIKEAGLDGKVFIRLKNFWNKDLSEFDVVVLFGMKHMMKKMEKKLQKELRPGAVVVLNYFTFPKWKPDKSKDGIYLYIKK